MIFVKKIIGVILSLYWFFYFGYRVMKNWEVIFVMIIMSLKYVNVYFECIYSS